MGRREDNLRPSEYKFTQEEAKKGARRSAEVRRRKKTMREALEMMMYQTELNEQTKQMLKAEGVTDTEDFNHQMVITRSLIAKAEAGDVQAYNAICAMIGEKPAEKMELSGGLSGEVRIKYVGSDDEDVFPSSETEVDSDR